jgi:hypothetical protein
VRADLIGYDETRTTRMMGRSPMVSSPAAGEPLVEVEALWPPAT